MIQAAVILWRRRLVHRIASGDRLLRPWMKLILYEGLDSSMAGYMRAHVPSVGCENGRAQFGQALI
jgi:hypothetical protein